jgi:hypothetical protein
LSSRTKAGAEKLSPRGLLAASRILHHDEVADRVIAEQLIRFVFLPAEVRARCNYCGAQIALRDGFIPQDILLFQESHFACDPHMAEGVPKQR